MKLDKDTKVGGNFAKNEEAYSLEIFLKACVIAVPGDCVINYNGTPTTTINTAQIASEYFRDY